MNADLVKRNDKGQTITTSLLVAEKFEKQHLHVLRDVDELAKDVSNFGLMFYESTYPDSYGRPQRMYIMNRDGFTLLAMGFTGDKALKFKLDFLAAFNKMEALLNSDEYILLRSQEILTNKVKQLEVNNQQLEKEVIAKQHLLEAAAPKVEWHDINQSSIGLHKMTTCVEKLNICAAYMNKVLMHYKIIRKAGQEYSFLAKYQNKGFGEQDPVSAGTHSDGTPRTRLEVSYYEKGRRLIYEVFKHAQKDGYVVKRRDGRWVIAKEYGYSEFKLSN